MQKFIAFLLACSALNLTLMIPGGPVETREFPDYPALVLIVYNVYLTVLGAASFYYAWVFARGRGVRGVVEWIGLGFVLVYGFDLARIFPVGNSPMPQALVGMEFLGVLLAAGLMLAGLTVRSQLAESGKSFDAGAKKLLIALIVFGGIAFVFASVVVTRG